MVWILLDTNIVVSALLWQGAPHHLLGAIQRQPGVQLFSSTTLLEELADVLGRPSVAKRLALIARTPGDLLADYVEAIELVGSARGGSLTRTTEPAEEGIAIIEAAEALRRLAARTA